jgi:hypothetical protein
MPNQLRGTATPKHLSLERDSVCVTGFASAFYWLKFNGRLRAKKGAPNGKRFAMLTAWWNL